MTPLNESFDESPGFTEIMSNIWSHVEEVNYTSALRTDLVRLKQFHPVNEWQTTQENSHNLYDVTTGDLYWGVNKTPLRIKFALLATLGTAAHTIIAVCSAVYRVFHGLYLAIAPGKSLKERLIEPLKEWLTIASDLITPVALFLFAIYGQIRPYDGRKLYASIERLRFGQYEVYDNAYGISTDRPGALAPCMQPEAQWHLLAGYSGNPDDL